VFFALAALATGIGAWLRLHGLAQPSFWVDEFFSIARAGRDPLHWSYAFGYEPTRLSLLLSGADLGRIGLDNIAQWQSLGVSERAARLGACWVGIATVPVLALLARPVLGGAVAGASALLLAMLPYHVYWSQMARYYTTEFLFVNAFLLLFLRGMQTGRISWLVAASLSAVLAFMSHFTALFVVGGCLGMTLLALLLRPSLPHLRMGIAFLAGTLAVCATMLLLKEIQSVQEATLASFSGQDWDPPLRILLLGTILRVEPVVFAVGSAFAVVALRRRDPVALLVAAMALLVPAGVLALKPLFPVGQRYYFACLFPWTLLAAMACVETERRVGEGGPWPLGLTALIAVTASVAVSAFLYVQDGSGHRTRWRDAFAYVAAHGDPADPVYVGPGRFQAQYYLERPAQELRLLEDPAAAAPGSWIVYRTRGERRPPFEPPVEAKARYGISGKPWSWVVYVLRVGAPE
jgi:hypothetical protein